MRLMEGMGCLRGRCGGRTRLEAGSRVRTCVFHFFPFCHKVDFSFFHRSAPRKAAPPPSTSPPFSTSSAEVPSPPPLCLCLFLSSHPSLTFSLSTNSLVSSFSRFVYGTRCNGSIASCSSPSLGATVSLVGRKSAASSSFARWSSPRLLLKALLPSV
jgi:hypothetical protein